MQKLLSSQVHIANFNPDLASKIREAYSELEKLQNEALKLFRASARYQAIVDLAASSYGGKTSPTTVVSGTTINITVAVELEDKGAAAQNPLYLDPKTTNLLLGGKLLSDQEKRLLLGRLTSGLFDQPETQE